MILRNSTDVLRSLWAEVPDHARRVIHTFWQVASPVLFTQLFMARSSQDVKAAIVIAGAAGLSAAKSLIINYLSNQNGTTF